MFSVDDTIVAIATPPGRGGLGVVRVSGPEARAIAAAIITRQAPLEPRHATFTRVRASSGTSRTPALDTVVATLFAAPQSYTGQDVVELSAHGAPVVLRGIVNAAIEAGARLAQPGEFTLRAFLGGKLNLVQAEAVADLIAAATPLQARVAFDQLEGTLTRRIAALDEAIFDLIAKLEASLDFPDEGYHFIEPIAIARAIEAVTGDLDSLLADAGRGRMIREGATVVVSGRPNVGKSSIFNMLAGAGRAIVTDIPGTTRDLITEPVEIEGIAVMLVDTAGSRETLNVIEREGVARGVEARAVADVILLVLDGSQPLTADDRALLDQTRDRRRLIIANKADLGSTLCEPTDISVSARTGEGIDSLRRAVARALTGDDTLRDTVAVSNMRHVSLLREARDRLRSAASAASGSTPEEFVLADLQAARARFDEIVGVRTSDDLLNHIFAKFCIGK